MFFVKPLLHQNKSMCAVFLWLNILKIAKNTDCHCQTTSLCFWFFLVGHIWLHCNPWKKVESINETGSVIKSLFKFLAFSLLSFKFITYWMTFKHDFSGERRNILCYIKVSCTVWVTFLLHFLSSVMRKSSPTCQHFHMIERRKSPLHIVPDIKKHWYNIQTKHIYSTERNGQKFTCPPGCHGYISAKQSCSLEIPAMLQSHVTREWMPIVPIPTAEKKPDASGC